MLIWLLEEQQFSLIWLEWQCALLTWIPYFNSCFLYIQALWDGKAWAQTTPSQVCTSMCVMWCSSAHGDVAPRPKHIQFLSDISALIWVCCTHVMTLRNLLFVWQVPIPGWWETAAEPWDRSAQTSSLFTLHYRSRCKSLLAAIMLMESFNLLSRKDKYAWDIR